LASTACNELGGDGVTAGGSSGVMAAVGWSSGALARMGSSVVVGSWGTLLAAAPLIRDSASSNIFWPASEEEEEEEGGAPPEVVVIDGAFAVELPLTPVKSSGFPSLSCKKRMRFVRFPTIVPASQSAS
jgi:hypothetical protein